MGNQTTCLLSNLSVASPSNNCRAPCPLDKIPCCATAEGFVGVHGAAPVATLLHFSSATRRRCGDTEEHGVTAAVVIGSSFRNDFNYDEIWPGIYCSQTQDCPALCPELHCHCCSASSSHLAQELGIFFPLFSTKWFYERKQTRICGEMWYLDYISCHIWPNLPYILCPS